MIKGLGTGIRASYGTSLILFRGAVGLWIGAAALEFLQHGVEWNLGIFAPDGNFESAMESPGFWIAGYAKVGAVMVFLCCFVPAAVPHFALNASAFGAPPVLAVALLLLDSFVVGYIALLLGCFQWTLYRTRILEAPP